jgi:glycosyltransferase involved in cell wall biosynthesis
MVPSDAKSILKAIKSRTTFLCVSTLEPRKGQQQLLDATEQLWQEGIDVNLAFVGSQGWKIEALAERINNHPENGQRLFWLQGISDEYLEQIYASCSCLVASSLNEGFGLPLIEAARHGIPIVARDIPVFREVAGACAYYFAGETSGELAKALTYWLDLHQKGLHPDARQISWSTWRESTEKLKAAIVETHYPRKQLLVDISELVQLDAKTGIQRVVRSVLREWLLNPPSGWRVEPVYATIDQPYHYARQFTSRFLGMPDESLMDEPIDYSPSDVFFGLDLQPQIQTAQASFFQHLRNQGVTVKFMVYDLLCVLQPGDFVPGAFDVFVSWLNVVGASDGAVCISKAVADDLAHWTQGKTWKRQLRFTIDWCHLGADVDNTASTQVLPAESDHIFTSIKQRPSFLMVGTLEPRKGYTQVLDAFETLWRNDINCNLVIVGKQGWMVEKLVERLRVHPELNKRLFWLEGISDEYLEKVYAASTCLIAASYGEGFGLPLIEASQHKLPIIARDIPVFREVARDYAYYFDGKEPHQLAESIKGWIGLYEKHRHPKSDNMPWLTWKESAQELLNKILHAGEPKK